MKIALDISKFAQGMIENSGKTGIYRYTSNLLEQMLSLPDLEMYFTLLRFPHAMEESLTYLKDKGHDINVLLKNSIFETYIYDCLKKYRSIPYSFWISLVVSSAFQSMKTRSLSHSFDIFHSCYFPIPDFIKFSYTKRFITIHDIIFILYPAFCKISQRKRTQKIIKSIDIHQDWVLAVSESTKNDLCEHTKISEERVFVTYLAASSKLYYPVKDENQISTILHALSIPRNEYFLSLATIEPRKNLQLAVRCFKKILFEPGLGHLNYILAGNKGWKTQPLYRDILADPVLNKRVIFSGFVPDGALSSLYSGSLAFIYPSLYEGFGLPPLEAMQCGTPVITSNTSSLPEVVGNAAVTIDPEDEDALCQAMIDIARNSAFRNDLSQKGIERAKLFSWKKCANETVKAYRFALDNC